MRKLSSQGGWGALGFIGGEGRLLAGGDSSGNNVQEWKGELG